MISRENMIKKYEVVVIGGGHAGVEAAAAAARMGVSVAFHSCRGTSCLNTSVATSNNNHIVKYVFSVVFHVKSFSYTKIREYYIQNILNINISKQTS